MIKSTSEIKKAAPETVLAGLLNADSTHASLEAASKLIKDAKDYGLDLRSYLRLSIDAGMAEDKSRFVANANGELLNGYEASLAYLNLPIRDDLDAGVMLQAAADTFQTYPGTRALFPEVVDDMVQWKVRQTNFETTDGMIANRRTISGNEMLSTVVEDTTADYEEAVRAVAEGGRIPIHSIRSSEKRVKFWKFGNGYKTTYEFQRRASLDILTPYAARTQKQIDRSKVAVATSVLLNGDGVTGAAGVVGQSSFNNANTTGTATAGKLSYKHLAAWLVSRAKAGAPIDTVLGNWDMYLQWLFLFAIPTTNNSMTDAEQLARTGFQIGGVPILSGNIQFKLSSDAPNNQLIGFSRDDTLEEMTEAGSQISESEKSIQTQEVTYVRTETSGFRLIFGDTRSVLDLAS
ncbi:capsid protein [Caulobacter phage Seuss]|uniref:Capsid protein n=1 Tax=Caulobacter phage Seuss TaxID=1675601 RepID=A0A0K1LM53_9CAUD|nr:major head protein [Caulobacter phage Seuss]AKU43539.1 capsid protein [Caulobacter phage Seuss]